MKQVRKQILKLTAVALTAIATIGGIMASSSEAFATTDIDIPVSDYGYGEYIVTARGVGYDGVQDEDLMRFYYYPVNGEIIANDDTGDYTANLEYAEDDGTEEATGIVASVTLQILDAEGNPVGPSPIKVLAPTKSTVFNLDEYNLPTGIYTVEATAYDRYGVMLYKPIKIGEINYTAIPVPDTGTLLQNLNISRQDYLITGLIIFSVAAIAGLAFVCSRKSKRTRLGHKRK